VEALTMVDAPLPEELENAIVGDVTGDGLLADVPRQIDETADDRSIGAVIEAFGDQPAVDLDEVEWQVPQAVERPEAGTELAE
jgi:hypothetical protein